ILEDSDPEVIVIHEDDSEDDECFDMSNPMAHVKKDPSPPQAATKSAGAQGKVVQQTRKQAKAIKSKTDNTSPSQPTEDPLTKAKPSVATGNASAKLSPSHSAKKPGNTNNGGPALRSPLSESDLDESFVSVQKVVASTSSTESSDVDETLPVNRTSITLSKWASRFLAPRAPAALVEDVDLQPMQDFILDDFGTRFRGDTTTSDHEHDEHAEASDGDESSRTLAVGAPICLERDLQGLHAATTTSLCEVEAMFGELVSMMAQSPRTSIALHWPDGKANANQLPLPTDDSTTVAVDDKATCTSSNQLETKATQTSEPQVACVSTVDRTHINLQISLEQCLSRQLRRNKLSALGERMKLRRVVLTWRKVTDQAGNDNTASEASAANAADEAPKIGKTQLRRLKREQIWTAVKEKKRLKKEEKKALRPAVEQPVLDMSDAAVLVRKERSILKRESFLMRANEGPTIVIDCGFEEDMTSREKKSLSQQIMFSYGVNKRSDTPATMFLTSLTGETEANLVKIGGFGTWLGVRSFFRSILHKNVNPHALVPVVYIIGGIVDRNRLKGATLDKAVAQGIQTAKLPLDKLLDMGQATRILVDYSNVRDWTQATLSALPGRKRATPKA
ncbi:hypothetical protein DYB31_008516, partial [Aphanomyces astaci]